MLPCKNGGCGAAGLDQASLGQQCSETAYGRATRLTASQGTFSWTCVVKCLFNQKLPIESDFTNLQKQSQVAFQKHTLDSRQVWQIRLVPCLPLRGAHLLQPLSPGAWHSP
jgi:hypothetical protein